VDVEGTIGSVGKKGRERGKREKREGGRNEGKEEGKEVGKQILLNYRITTPPVPCLLVRSMVDAKLFGRTI
jgi:hypothetical protein